ncbi:MAG TPA: ATP-dependent DNA helicase RecQ [Candidatus Thermoplasmatota archaeon]|nr:ATP-dependent DNA helicase RecQ [Candidatus Thermoplasmatota archaeon]
MSRPVTPDEIAEAAALVKRHLGHASLRPGQDEALVRVLRGEDVFAILATGSGKSLLFQLPAVLSPGVTLVVSPLIALMKDQLDSLPAPMRAAAVAVTGEMAPFEARRAVDDIAAGRYRLVYAAPERLRQAGFVAALKRAGVKRFAVDEAHCVSLWGHDFRPDYLALADARRRLGSPPVLAVTATAPPRVAEDILARLGAMTVVRASVDRPNIRWEAVLARDADEKLAHVATFCRDAEGQGVVYVSSRDKADLIAGALASLGIASASYHAGILDRAAVQDRFMAGEVRVLVATIAFGMGVDKPDIRFIAHHDPSSSLEAYYQEAGRAGRDGLPARALLVAAPADGAQLVSHARRDLPSLDLVAAVERLVAEGARGDFAVVDPAKLDALDREEVRPRVALSILVEAGRLARLPDVPRTIAIDRAQDPALVALRGQATDVFALAPILGVGPEDVEARLAEMSDRGAVGYETWDRDLLFRRVDAKGSVSEVLSRYKALSEARAREVVAYAESKGCRRAALRRHFGDPDVPATCGACDRCLGLAHVADARIAPDDAAVRRAILDALGSLRGLGEANLVKMLRGDTSGGDWLASKPGFGALALRSDAAIKGALKQLAAEGAIRKETLAHGGETWRLARDGDPKPVARPPSRGAPAAAHETLAEPRERAPRAEVPAEAAPLLEALKAWRGRLAREARVPAYVIASDATLEAIAVARPRTVPELLAVKGIGPKKAEMFGEDILAVVASAP